MISRWLILVCVVASALASAAGCGDRAPPPLWPEPPPPTLAEPIGIDDSSEPNERGEREDGASTSAGGAEDEPAAAPEGHGGDTGAPAEQTHPHGPSATTARLW